MRAVPGLALLGPFAAFRKLLLLSMPDLAREFHQHFVNRRLRRVILFLYVQVWTGHNEMHFGGERRTTRRVSLQGDFRDINARKF